MIYRVDFFLHCTGMEFPDKRNFGEWQAVSPEDAIEQVLEASFAHATKADREYIKGCLTASPVGVNCHPPRTDDVILVHKRDIPKMARILCNRILEPDMRHEEEVWLLEKDTFIKDIQAILGIDEHEKF